MAPEAYSTDKFVAYKDGKRKNRLSMAIWLTDDFTKKKPLGRIKMFIEGRKERSNHVKI